MRRRNCLYKKLKRSNSTSLSKAYSKCHNLTGASTSDFWKAVKNLNSDTISIPNLNLPDGNVATTPVDKANALNFFFQSYFNCSCPPLSCHNLLNLPSSECPDELLCSEDEVLELLLSIDISKASGPDGISGCMLKSTAFTIAPVITELFNLSIRSGIVPSAWKHSAIVPIPKGKADLSNSRPVSLLSICSKLLERHISSILMDYIYENNLLGSNQWGFLPGKSTTAALLSVVHDWHLHLNSNTEVFCCLF